MLLTQKSILNELEYVSKILEDINNGIRAEKVITKDHHGNIDFKLRINLRIFGSLRFTKKFEI